MIRSYNAGSSNGRFSHGMSRTKIYALWVAMHNRCGNPKCETYDLYGGRGIKVCGRWDAFENFYADMGDRPAGTSLDRIDVNGNYEPGNCRWATRNQQSRNMRTNVWVTLDGERICFSDACKRLGVKRNIAGMRAKYHGLAPQQAIDFYVSARALKAAQIFTKFNEIFTEVA